MTLREVAYLLGKSEKTIQKNLRRTQDTLRKRGIILTKWGEGKNAEYDLEYEERDEDEEY